ncbi:MAG: DUF481 domain-containing protein [Acidobacteriota bacterium]|nr:DUF481 domain-containing protein [Acidobacteriota bacterium]
MRLSGLVNSTPSFLFRRGIRFLLLVAAFGGALACAAQTKPAPDVLVLSNGDTLHGKFVSVVQGTVTFHSDVLGDISLTWDKIKELHTSEPYAVIDNKRKVTGRKQAAQIPTGTLQVENETLTLRPEAAAAPTQMPVKSTQFIMDEATLDKQVNHSPGLMTGWNGAATAGATMVTATQNQYTFSGGVGLVRVVPTVSWLNPRDRTSLDFTGSYGKITQPAYMAADVLVPAVVTKSAIYHADAERDEYFSPRFYALAQTAFDHNFAQNLDLQQIYGGGFGWTFFKTPRQEADLKATMQYEKQKFMISGPGSSLNLVGSTFGANYALHLKLVTYLQSLAYIPAYNNMHAYSTYETNTLTFPVYKNFGFSIGTMDSYLNDPPVSEPPTKRNSFQFTMGLSYAIKSKY